MSTLRLALLLIIVSGCKTAQNDAPASVALDAQPGGAGSFPSAQILYNVGKSFKAGEFFEIPLDPARQVEQITIKFHGKYTLVEKDAAGNPILNDEGKPRYKDGIYAYGYSLSPAGEKREIAAKKFVDAFETDNWHDLVNVQGAKLRVEFRHGSQYVNDPELLALARKISVESVLVRYVDAPGQLFQEFVYNADDDFSMSPDAVTVQSGGSHRVNVDKTRKIYRIDVRWGDEKPRVDGVYVPGTASGTLRINGKSQGTRNVAAVETQVWAPVDYPASNQVAHNIDFLFSGDKARIHWIRVYYTP